MFAVDTIHKVQTCTRCIFGPNPTCLPYTISYSLSIIRNAKRTFAWGATLTFYISYKCYLIKECAFFDAILRNSIHHTTIAYYILLVSLPTQKFAHLPYCYQSLLNVRRYDVRGASSGIMLTSSFLNFGKEVEKIKQGAPRHQVTQRCHTQKFRKESRLKSEYRH